MNPIANNNINFNGKVNPRLANIITKMSKADALEPVIALEATVVAGRTFQAYRRGKGDEARERFIEEINGSIVWLWGVKVLNEIGDKIINKILKQKGVVFDVGTDNVLRRPFDNYMQKGAPKGISANKVALLKGAKVCTSIVLANLFIGFVVPKINHYLTKVIRHNKHEKELAAQRNNDNNTNTNLNNTQQTSFKGGSIAALNVFTNAIENTNTGKLLSTDIGVAGGRMYNARSKEERREIAFRDIGSIYFYMWASGHVGNVLNLIESGRTTRLDPETTRILDEYLNKLVETNGKSLTVEQFRELALGKNIADIKLPEGIEFESGKLSMFEKLTNKFRKVPKEPLMVAKVVDLEKLNIDESTMARIRKMSELQPHRLGEAVVTKQQIIDAFNVAEANNPELLSKVFNTATENASSDPYKYVSNKKLYNLKSRMEDYIKDVCKLAKDGKITKEVLDNAMKKNIVYNGLNLAAGFSVAALFLSTLIPKMQYYITKKQTGVDAFPGTYDYENHREIEA